MTSIDKLKKSLDLAARKKGAERAVIIAAVIAEALRPIDQDPVLVGGAAVAFYTQGGYATADIDLVAPGGAPLIQVMTDLGFKKIGKDFVDNKRKIYVEFPSRSLKPFEQADQLKIHQHTLRIISIEDLIVDRLCAYKFWQSAIDGLNALLLLELGRAEEKRLLKRAEEDDVSDALRAVQQVREEAIRKNLSKPRANRLLEGRMRELRSIES